MNCRNCLHYRFREMIKQPYAYSGEIPCLTCSRFIHLEDNFIPRPESKPDVLGKNCRKNEVTTPSKSGDSRPECEEHEWKEYKTTPRGKQCQRCGEWVSYENPNEHEKT